MLVDVGYIYNSVEGLGSISVALFPEQRLVMEPTEGLGRRECYTRKKYATMHVIVGAEVCKAH